jgi:hypothetical protein
MKKLLLILLCFPMIFSSCKKCKECTLSNVMGDSGTEEICRDDFDSNEEYNAYIQIIEDIGGTCK